MGELDREINAATGMSFFYGWNVRRRYSDAELAAADCFKLQVIPTFEPAGEECGTEYDEQSACPRCGAGARQVSDLFLDWRRIPKNKDMAQTIAGETVVSKRLVELFRQHGITGAEFRPCRRSPASSAESKDWFQLVVASAEAEIVPPTRVGIGPFDDDLKGECCCSLGDLIGLNIMSEVSVNSATRGPDDIVCTRQFIGTRRGLLRPERIILISPKLRRLIESERLKRCETEVVHLISSG